MPVPGARRSVTLTLRCPSRARAALPCIQVPLTRAEQFSVQENDIIAACLPTSRAIQVVGEQISGPSMGVYQYSASGFERCSDSQLPSVSTQSTGFSLSGGRLRLHLYAEVNSK